MMIDGIPNKAYFNLLDLFIVRGGDTVQVGRYLSSKISRGYEGTQNILGQNIGE